MCLLASTVAQAADPAYEKPFGAPAYVPDADWQEAQVPLPPLPKRGDLAELDLSFRNTPYTYLLDLVTLVPGQDGIVRYTIVLRAKEGARNIFREGIRCDADEYRTYAVAIDEGAWQTRNEKWQHITRTGAMAYRGDLLDHFLCNQAQPRTPEAIRDLARHKYDLLPSGEQFLNR